MTPAQSEPLSEATNALLRKASSATLTTQLFKRGYKQRFLVGVRPMTPDVAGFVGQAFTMRHIAAREDLDTLDSLRSPDSLQIKAIETVPEGHVLMIDSRDDISAASLGDILLTRLKVRGTAGAVTDGAFRDGPVIETMGFAAYARASTATTRCSSFHVADLQCPIQCGGVAVFPGDVVVGDREGVVVIPREITDEVAQEAAEQEELEVWLQKKIKGGTPLYGTYPPQDDAMAEYRASKAKA